MPGRDFTNVRLTSPSWDLPVYHEHYTLPSGQTLFQGEKVRVAGRQGLFTFVQHRDHPKEQSVVVKPADGVSFAVAVDKVQPAKGKR